jgi:hypothetical protein
MVKSDFYNSVLDKLLDEVEADGIITKKDKIVCCTNKNSQIALKLQARGYNATEEDTKGFNGDCTVFVPLLRHIDVFQMMEKLSHDVKVLALYRMILLTEDDEENKKIQQFYVRSIGTTEILDEIDEKSGKKWSEPFDNRVFYYNFSGVKS